MKILYGITKSNFGGAQRYVFDLAVGARNAGHEVSVLCGKGGKLTEKLKEVGIRSKVLEYLERDISIQNEYRALREIIHILQSEKPDVFHINSSKMGGLGAIAGRIAGVKKIVFTSHGWAFNENRPWWQKFLIKVLAWVTMLLSHKVIYVSKRTGVAFNNWPFIHEKTITIHNGVGQFEAKARRASDTLTVGALSELHWIKGLDILLSAWKKFTKSHNGKLIIMGEGEERGNLEKLIEKLGIKDSVELKGFVNDARSYLNTFDIFVLPSRSENMPYSLLEAGYLGLPTIATYVGGVSEVVETGISGVLVPKEDSEAILSSLILMAENPDLRTRLGNKLQEKVRVNFSIEQMLEKTLNTYRG